MAVTGYDECTRFLGLPPPSILSNLHEHISRRKLNTFEGRLATFENWPSGLPMNPENLAKSGLFYTGNENESNILQQRYFLRFFNQQEGTIVAYAILAMEV